MAAVRSKGSKEEMLLSKSLWREGFRFRKNDKSIKGTPDISIKKYKLAVFVDGEFWHGYNWAIRKSDIKSNQEFWHKKIERNIERDREITTFLEEAGWTVLRFWSKEVKKNTADCISSIASSIELAKSR